MNKLEIDKTYLLAAINGKYPRHSIEVVSERTDGSFDCTVYYCPDDDNPTTGCSFRPDGTSMYLGADCRVDWAEVNSPAEPVAVSPCVAHADCNEQMQEARVVGFREALATMDGLTEPVGLVAHISCDEPPPVGVKADGGKPMPRLLHESMAGAVASVVDVLSFGARKYSDDNWKNVEPKRYTDALYRHLNAHHKGESNDAESGLPHLAHAACCVLFLLHHEVNK